MQVRTVLKNDLHPTPPLHFFLPPDWLRPIRAATPLAERPVSLAPFSLKFCASHGEGPPPGTVPKRLLGRSLSQSRPSLHSDDPPSPRFKLRTHAGRNQGKRP